MAANNNQANQSTGGGETPKVAPSPKSSTVVQVKPVTNEDSATKLNLDMEKGNTKSPPQPAEQSDNNSPKHTLSGSRLVVLFVGMCTSVFLTALDLTIVSTALPKITSDLNSFADYSWVTTAYLLTSTAIQPLYGRFSDIFGRKPLVLFAILMFELGSLLCAVATSMNMLIIARAVAGIGGAGLISMVYIVIGDVINMRDRAKYQGIVSATWGLASVVGPLLGGAFADHVSWRWCFYINLPFGAVSVIAVCLCLNLPHTPGNIKEKLLMIDYFGVATLLPGIVSLLLAVSWGGNQYAWDSAVIISLFAVAAVLVTTFVCAEAFVAKVPIMVMALYKVRNYTLMTTCNFFVGFVMLGTILYLPVYFQVVKGDTATASGLRSLPFMLSLVLFSMLSGLFISKTGMYRFIPAFGAAILTLGMGVLMLLREDSTFGELVAILLPAGFGLGFLFQSCLLVTQAAVANNMLAAATAAVTFFRSIGGVIGVAVCGAVLNNSVAARLASNPLTAEYSTTHFNLNALQTATPAVRELVVAAFVEGIHNVFEVATPVIGIGFLLALFVKYIPLKTVMGSAPSPLVTSASSSLLGVYTPSFYIRNKNKIAPERRSHGTVSVVLVNKDNKFVHE